MIHTERLIIREWRADDFEPFAALNACPEVCAFLPKQLTRAESDAMAHRIIAHFKEHGFGLYAVEVKETGTFIGYTGVTLQTFDAHFMPAIEIGWRLSRDHWGQGYASEAARAVLAHTAAHQPASDIVSYTVPHNLRSRRVMEKIGLQHDTEGDFELPLLPKGHALRKHVLYRYLR